MKTYLIGDKQIEVPESVTIECAEVLDFITRKEISKSFEIDSELSHATETVVYLDLDGYDKSYRITLGCEENHVPEDTGASHMGYSESFEAYDYLEAVSIKKVEIFKDGYPTEIPFDQYTEKELLNQIDVDHE